MRKRLYDFSPDEIHKHYKSVMEKFDLLPDEERYYRKYYERKNMISTLWGLCPINGAEEFIAHCKTGENPDHWLYHNIKPIEKPIENTTEKPKKKSFFHD